MSHDHMSLDELINLTQALLNVPQFWTGYFKTKLPFEDVISAIMKASNSSLMCSNL